MVKQQLSSFSISWFQHISDIDKNAWNALAASLSTPFFEWEWLRLMETSRSTTAKTGWQPCHLTVWAGRNLIAAAPLYVKGHSAGEFVFDHVWADVALQLGTNYYPKLVGMSPFTPMVGYRFLIAPGENESALTRLMLNEIDRFCRRFNISGSSFLFVDPQWHRKIAELGYLSWMHQSFVWQNHSYNSFDDYLTLFNSNQRRNIKRERKALEKRGITMTTYCGDEIPRNLFPLMYTYYRRTNDKFGPWGCRYLTQSFFDDLYQNFRHRLVIVAAFEHHTNSLPVGMSMLVTKKDKLYGRYWGSAKTVNSLHFNACYYTPIDWAICNGIQSFDPGAGGAHKIRRGFRAIPNFSLHRFRDPRLSRIMETHLDEINRLEQEQIDTLNQEIPFAQHMKNPELKDPAFDIRVN